MTHEVDTVPLGQLCELISEQVLPRHLPHALYVGLEHVASGRFVRIGGGLASDVQSSKFLFRRGDVLYGKLRPYLDKAVLAEEDGLCTTELLVLRARAGIDPRFLLAVLHSGAFIEHSTSGTTGSQHPRTSWHRISEFGVPRFSPDERAKIADLVWTAHDSLLSCERAIQCASELKMVALRELLARGLRGEPQKETAVGLVPRTWEVAKLGEVARIERGRFMHRPRNEPRFYGGNTPFVQTGDIVRSRGRVREYSQTLNADGVAISRVFPAGTILITIAANIGYTAVLQFDSACPDSLVALTPTGPVDTLFLEYFLETQQSEMDRRAPKGTQKNINIQFLNPWPVPVPPTAEQEEIVAALTAIDEKVETQHRKRAILDELHHLLLRKLMAGKVSIADLEPSAIKEKPANTVFEA
jgi:type I restriction enzyme, S subunit